MYRRRGTARMKALRRAAFDAKIAAYVEALRNEPAPPPPANVSAMDFFRSLAGLPVDEPRDA